MKKKTNIKLDLTKIIIAVTLIAGVSMIARGIMVQPIISANNEKAKKIAAEIETEKKNIEDIDNTMKQTGTDEYVEKIAREKLGMIKADEIVFVDISGQ